LYTNNLPIFSNEEHVNAGSLYLHGSNFSSSFKYTFVRCIVSNNDNIQYKIKKWFAKISNQHHLQISKKFMQEHWCIDIKSADFDFWWWDWN